ncbi:MAG: helix-hairpin-helix domain-containing protein [Bacteroidetes bacterium]|nr:helix-hairpin-helix domain-containing protein [Bacteroidota bacterium]MCW5897315.1 helix-hairpin-helix domain-containing protein [Bacteroidota bacterium]
MSLTRCVFSAVFLCAGGIASPLSAQVLQDSLGIYSGIDAEELLEQIETEAENSELLDRLEWLQEHPLDLNTASREELASIPLLNPDEIERIVNLRGKLKRFMSVELIGLVEGGQELLSRIRKYVFVAETESNAGRGFSSRLRSRVVRDVQQRRGFQNGSFAGSPLKSYSRLSVRQSDNLQVGVLFEKDAGEETGSGFISGHLAFRDMSFVSQAIIGDYIVEAGQGLVLWRASAFGKGSEAVSVIKKSGAAVQPYRSTDEFNFLRGVAVSSGVEIGEDKLNMTAFYSRRALSASGDDVAVSSFYRDGLFRTDNELRRKSNVDERIIGGRLRFSTDEMFAVGTTAYHSSFSKPVVANRLFEFEGTSASVFGVDAEMHLGWLAPDLSQITLFGEFARSQFSASAGIVGSIVNLTRGSRLALIYRDYSPRFQSLHASGFGERSDTKNERGFYVGAEIRVTPSFHVSGFIDHFKSPWRTFDNPLPGSGRDIFVQANVKPLNRLSLSLRYRGKTTESSQASVDEFLRETRLLVNRQQQKVRMTASFQATKQMRLRGRVEGTIVDYAFVNRDQRGWLFFQDIQYLPHPALVVEARLIFFHTDSYDSRLYEYESDLRGVFSNPAMFGKGRRWYVLLRWNILPEIRLSAKYSETQKEGVKTIGSGLTEIDGNLDNRISVQMEVNLD